MNNQTVQSTTGEQLDASVVTLAKSIRTVESSDNYNAHGQSGEFGAYQFMPETWKGAAKKVLGNANAPMTPVNQDKVAYYTIKKLKDAGHTPEEVASIWNSGKPQWQGNVGVNSKGVKFDTPAYVNSVIDKYVQLRDGIQNGETQPTTSTVQPTQPEEKKSVGGFVGNIFSSGAKLIGDTAQAIGNVFNPNMEQNTLATLGKTGLGAIEKLIPGTQDSEKYANALGQYFKERYGGANEIGNTMYKDPVGFLLDLSTVLGGGGAAIKGASTLGKAGELSSLSKIGEIMKAVDPAVTAGKIVDSLSDWKNIKLDSAAVKLENSNLGWTKGDKAKLGDRVNEINKFGAKLKNIGTPEERVQLASEVTSNFQKRMDFAAEQSAVTIAKEDVIAKLESLKSGLETKPRFAKEVNRAVDSAIESIDSVPGSALTMEELNNLKKDIYGDVNYYGKSNYTNMADKSVAQTMKTLLEKSMDDAGETINGVKIADFNKEYGVALEYLKQLKKAIAKGGPGLVGKGLGAFVGNKLGEVVGGLPGELAGTVVGEKIAEVVGGVRAKSRLGAGLMKSAEKSRTGSGIVRKAGKVLKKTVKPGYYSEEINKKI
jgi:hypothetical protein